MLAEITPGLFSQVTCFTIVPVAQCDNCNLDEVLLIQDTPQYITAGQVDMYIKTTNIYENIRLKRKVCTNLNAWKYYHSRNTQFWCIFFLTLSHTWDV